MIFGYARVSTQEQDLKLQLDALNKAGVEEIFQEKVSGKNKERPELKKMIDILRKGDKVVIYKLDRLGRSLRDLIAIMEEFQSKGVDLQILQGLQLDTSNATGKLMFQIIGAFSEYERELIRERTMAGLESARARGKQGGRPKKNSDKVDLALKMYQDKRYSIPEILDATGLSKTTLYRYINNK